jgi:hypothetical protein
MQQTKQDASSASHYLKELVYDPRRSVPLGENTITLREEIISQIREAFGCNHYPGDPFLQGSFDGSEPYDEVSAFFGKTDWSKLDSVMLDRHYCALSFLSEGGFRFFLPAYLIADVDDKLVTADPSFHLLHGFATSSTEVPIGSQTFHRCSGGRTLMNPKRYGAMTWNDYARYRFSVFTREEAKAIVAYLTYKREHATTDLNKSRIDAALREFWLDRAENAPAREILQVHVQEEERFSTAIQHMQQEMK